MTTEEMIKELTDEHVLGVWIEPELALSVAAKLRAAEELAKYLDLSLNREWTETLPGLAQDLECLLQDYRKAGGSNE